MFSYDLSSELAVITVSGKDSHKFLNGQLTQDVNILNTGQWAYTAYLNNKGRILAVFWIQKVTNDGYYLITPKELANHIIERLKIFILRAEVQINLLNNFIYFSNNIQIDHIVLPLNDSHYLSITDHKNNNSEKNLDKWHYFLVKYGISLIYKETQELFVPQHIDLDHLFAISYKKGCYVGQEIVARLHYLGKPKRTLYRFTSKNNVKIGQELVSPLFDRQEVGYIVEVAYESASNLYVGLLSIQIDAIEQAFLDRNYQLPITIAPL